MMNTIIIHTILQSNDANPALRDDPNVAPDVESACGRRNPGYDETKLNL